jgi:hypothetical protein
MGEISAIADAAKAAGLTLEQAALFLGGLPKPPTAEPAKARSTRRR